MTNNEHNFPLLPPGYFELRPWGSFTVLEDSTTHKVKRLVVNPNKRISLQRHQQRTEHWVIIAGVATVTLNELCALHAPGSTILIVEGTKHRLANNGTEPLIVIEVQRGSYFGEDDIERFDDDFGRS